LLVFGSALLVTSVWAAFIAATAIFAALFVLLGRREESAPRAILWGFAAISFFALCAAGEVVFELANLVGNNEDESQLLAGLR
jgi:hypothetical protein